jgi:hypothetical protein
LLQQCVYDEFDIYDTNVCAALYQEHDAQQAMREGPTTSLGGVFSGGVVGAFSLEYGVVYGGQGQYGCYKTLCGGATTDISISVGFAVGVYTHWSKFAGDSVVVAAGVSSPVFEIGFSQSHVMSAPPADTEYIGMVHAFTIGVGFLPANVQSYACTTEVGVVRETYSPDPPTEAANNFKVSRLGCSTYLHTELVAGGSVSCISPPVSLHLSTSKI